MELEYSESLEKQAASYRLLAEETGICFPTIGMNIFCNSSYTSADHDAAYFARHIRKAADLACELGCKIIQIPAFFASAIKTEDDLKRAAANLWTACNIAKEHGLMIGTENALDLEQNRKLFALVDRPELKFYFDSQNLKQMRGISCLSTLEGMYGQLCEVHVKDSNECGWSALGKGEMEFFESAAMLKQLGYTGWVHLETDYRALIHSNDAEEVLDAIKRDLQTVRSVLEKE